MESASGAGAGGEASSAPIDSAGAGEQPQAGDGGARFTAGGAEARGGSMSAGGATPATEGGLGGSQETAGGEGAGGEAELPRARGRVVDFATGRALAGRRVVVGASLTKSTPVVETNEDGSFEFDEADSYQVLIIDPDGSTVSFYAGLRGSEPVLIHHPSQAVPAPRSIASLTGTLSGGAEYPLTGANDMVVVHFLSSEVTTRNYIGGSALDMGPDYALWPAFQSKQISGKLLALGIFRDPSDENAYSASAAMKELSVADGETYSEDLTLAPLPLGRIAGKVNVPAGWRFSQTSEYYRFPIPDARVGFPYAAQTRVNPLTNAGAFDYEVPDLRELGGQLCVVGIAEEVVPDSDGVLWSEACDLALDGESIAIDFEDVPQLTEPAPSGSFGGGARFSWSRPGSLSAPNLVELEPPFASDTTPAISIFSTSDTAMLPDLAVWGVELPASSPYVARAVALASDASDAFAAEGFGALTPRARRMSYAAPVPLVVNP